VRIRDRQLPPPCLPSRITCQQRSNFNDENLSLGGYNETEILFL